jgi:hypothetical protein
VLLRVIFALREGDERDVVSASDVEERIEAQTLGGRR